MTTPTIHKSALHSMMSEFEMLNHALAAWNNKDELKRVSGSTVPTRVLIPIDACLTNARNDVRNRLLAYNIEMASATDPRHDAYDPPHCAIPL